MSQSQKKRNKNNKMITSSIQEQDSKLKRKYINNNLLSVHKFKKTLPTINNHNVQMSHNINISRHMSELPILPPPPIVTIVEDYQQAPQLPTGPTCLDTPQRGNHKRKFEELVITSLPSPKSPKRPRSLCSPGTAEGESGQG